MFQHVAATPNVTRVQSFVSVRPGSSSVRLGNSSSKHNAPRTSVAAAASATTEAVRHRTELVEPPQQHQGVTFQSPAPATAWWEVECPPNMLNVGSLDELVTTVEGEQCPSSGRLVVVNFFAPECYACKSLQPKLRQIAGNNPDVLFLKVNGLEGDLQGYCEAMGITRIPYFHFYRANKRVSEFTANMRPDKLAMLRAEIAAHKPQAFKAADTPQYTALEA